MNGKAMAEELAAAERFPDRLGNAGLIALGHRDALTTFFLGPIGRTDGETLYYMLWAVEMLPQMVGFKEVTAS